jgi:hypothetical protein
MAYMGRGGGMNFVELISCPSHFSDTFRRRRQRRRRQVALAISVVKFCSKVLSGVSSFQRDAQMPVYS